MKRIGREELSDLVQKLEQLTGHPLDVVLVGGAGVMALTPQVRPTRDIDILWTDSLLELRAIIGPEAWEGLCSFASLSARSDPFEVYLPNDWEERAVQSSLSTALVRVLTPCPEDLASMKVFRLLARDADDIQALSLLAGFDRTAFRRAFCATLPFAIGAPSWHAESFGMVWNGLYPEHPVRPESVLIEAGVKMNTSSHEA